jgi:hypothetical protein
MKSDDLISRQTAIDGFYEMASDMDHLCTVSDYVSFLESLPPAQPEIIYCKDCKYSQGDVFDRGLFCTHGPTWFDVNDNHYCSWRERKTNFYG